MRNLTRHSLVRPRAWVLMCAAVFLLYSGRPPQAAAGDRRLALLMVPMHEGEGDAKAGAHSCYLTIKRRVATQYVMHKGLARASLARRMKRDASRLENWRTLAAQDFGGLPNWEFDRWRLGVGAGAEELGEGYPDALVMIACDAQGVDLVVVNVFNKGLLRTRINAPSSEARHELTAELILRAGWNDHVP